MGSNLGLIIGLSIGITALLLVIGGIFQWACYLGDKYRRTNFTTKHRKGPSHGENAKKKKFFRRRQNNSNSSANNNQHSSKASIMSRTLSRLSSSSSFFVWSPADLEDSGNHIENLTPGRTVDLEKDCLPIFVPYKSPQAPEIAFPEPTIGGHRIQHTAYREPPHAAMFPRTGNWWTATPPVRPYLNFPVPSPATVTAPAPAYLGGNSIRVGNVPRFQTPAPNTLSVRPISMAASIAGTFVIGSDSSSSRRSSVASTLSWYSQEENATSQVAFDVARRLEEGAQYEDYRLSVGEEDYRLSVVDEDPFEYDDLDLSDDVANIV